MRVLILQSGEIMNHIRNQFTCEEVVRKYFYSSAAMFAAFCYGLSCCCMLHCCGTAMAREKLILAVEHSLPPCSWNLRDPYDPALCELNVTNLISCPLYSQSYSLRQLLGSLKHLAWCCYEKAAQFEHWTDCLAALPLEAPSLPI